MQLYILTAYNGEPSSVYSNYLQSLNEQENIDFQNITIVISRSDCGTFPDVTNYSNIKNRVICISQEQDMHGPGQSRRIGLNYIKAIADKNDYLIFLDIDDQLLDNSTLNFLMNNPDYKGKDFVELAALRHNELDGEDTWVQGNAWEVWTKYIRIGYLIDNNINFSPNLMSAEDCFFVACMQACAYKRDMMDFLHSYCYHRDQLNSSTLWTFLRKVPLSQIIQDSYTCIEEFMNWCKSIKNPVYTSELYTVMKGLAGFIDGRLETVSEREFNSFKDMFRNLLDRWDYLIAINNMVGDIDDRVLAWIAEKRAQYMEG